MTDTAGSRNDGTVDLLLREAGFDDDAVLHAALVELRGLAAVQPQASAAVAALMAPAAAPAGQAPATTRLAIVPDVAACPATEALAAPDLAAPDLAVPALAAPDLAGQDMAGQDPAGQDTAGPAEQATGSPATATDELAARRRAKRRITLTTLSLAASLAAGGAVAVASDQGVRDSIGQLQHAVASFVATAGGGPAPAPFQAPAPAPAQPGPPASHPAGPTATAPATAAPESGPGEAAQHTSEPTGPAHVPVPDLSLPENVTPGIPGEPLNGGGPSSTLPLPSTAPVQVPGIHP